MFNLGDIVVYKTDFGNVRNGKIVQVSEIKDSINKDVVGLRKYEVNSFTEGIYVDSIFEDSIIKAYSMYYEK